MTITLRTVRETQAPASSGGRRVRLDNPQRAPLVAILGLSLAAILPVSAASSAFAAPARHGTPSKHVPIRSYKFKPTTVTIAPGTTVIWTNKDMDNHSVTSDRSSHESFDSGQMVNGHSFKITFKSAGTFRYHCSYHAFMKGVVIVRKMRYRLRHHPDRSGPVAPDP